MTELRTGHTADLVAAELAAIRGLMDDTFDGVSGELTCDWRPASLW